ncbi:MAG: glycosyltransferase, partial [Candidatus Marivariicella sp.]
DKIPQGEFSKKGLVDHIAAFIRGNFFIPDARVNWAKSAIKEALRIVKSHKIEKIITTGPPHSTHLIGLNLKKQHNLKWIADFRDPWTDIFYVKSFYRLSFAKKKDKLFERKVLSNANAIITTTSENFQKDLQSKISINQNFFKIYNGYDSDLFKKIKKRKNKDFQIVFTGLLTENHPYKEFIESFIKFLKKDPKVNVKIILAGSISEKILNEFNRISNIEFHGYINHQDAVNLMIDGNILLNFMYKQEKNTTMISGKLIEYMATGNPVLMIGDKKSEASKLLSKQTYNLTADPKETKIISNFIKSNYINWIEKKEIKNEIDVIKDYTREETTRSLIEIIEKI